MYNLFYKVLHLSSFTTNIPVDKLVYNYNRVFTSHTISPDEHMQLKLILTIYKLGLME